MIDPRQNLSQWMTEAIQSGYAEREPLKYALTVIQVTIEGVGDAITNGGIDHGTLPCDY